MGQPQLKEKPEHTSQPATDVAAASEPARPRSPRPAALSRAGLAVLASVILALNIPIIHRALRGAQPVTATVPYLDDFSDPSTVSRNYWNTGGHWRGGLGGWGGPG